MQQVETIERARYRLDAGESEMSGERYGERCGRSSETLHPASPHAPGKQKGNGRAPHPAALQRPGKQRSGDGTLHPGLPRVRS